MDELMGSIMNRTPINRHRFFIDPISSIHKTLREHYQQKRSRYGVNIPHVYDSELIMLFKGDGNENSGSRSAATFLRKYQAELCDACARGTGLYPYDIAQIVQKMILRCRELGLTISRTDQEVKRDVAIFIIMQSFDYRQRLGYRIVI